MTRGQSAGRAWWVWGAGLSAYVLGVFHRSSLAVAGLYATERFAISSAQLSALVVVQLLAYALLQVPLGIVLDRIGARRLLLTGVAVMTAGQVIFAVAESYPAALVARILVGAGDAATFICVLRLVAAWFAPRRVPMVSQVTGPAGQVGALAAAVPMTWALSTLGWQQSYLIAASVGLVVAVVLLVVVDDAPGVRHVAGAPVEARAIVRVLGESWGDPWTRLGFWVHFTHHFSATSLALVWGFPFLVTGEGLSEHRAGLLLSLLVVAVMVAGPAVGAIITVRPQARVRLAVGATLLTMAIWAAVLLWPGPSPLAALVALVLVVGMCGPVAMVGFDFVREHAPSARLGGALGIVNQGGFLASLTVILVIGLVLDLVSPGRAEMSAAGLALAMWSQFPLWIVGLLQIVRLHRLARRQAASADQSVTETKDGVILMINSDVAAAAGKVGT